jgi:poly [ADP-ribose] polymerase 10/14/15
LRIAEQEGYNSIALPAISAATYGFPLQDCTNILIRTVKQFFADFPESNLRKVILLDNDDAACNSFAREVGKDHTNIAADNNDDITKYDLPPLKAAWRWQDDDGEKNYDDTYTRQIEDAFQHYLQTDIPPTLKINVDNLTSATIVCYSIHFRPNFKQIFTINPNALNARLICGYQMRDDTDFKRVIIRYPVLSPVHNTSAEYRPKPLDAYHLKIQSKEDDWDITGINRVAVKQAEMEIKKAIVSSMISEPFSVNLNEDIDVHKTAITNIAIQQFIQVDFQQDSTGNLSLILKGFPQNILQAKLQISLYVQDILRMEADQDDQLNIPGEWGEQEEQCKLVALPNNHPDFIRIESRMKETMTNVKIDKIERVQNLRFWNHYAFRRRTLQQELIDKPNLQIEMELFHGTRTTPPNEIYNGEYGFDMTYCTSGLWGTGTYFAMNASYSCQSYSYQLPNGKRQVFLAQVLTGEVCDYKDKHDQTLRRPPRKNESISGGRYNSVSGVTGGDQVYIVYENRVSYPTFLITFSS